MCVWVCSTQITLGDAIVCWRACVVWHKRRPVAAACSALVCATFGECQCAPASSSIPLRNSNSTDVALGVAATALSCDAHQRGLHSQCAVMFTTGVMYERFPAGIAACVLSLVTNVFATGLIGYKAWCVRPRPFSVLLSRSAGSHACVALQGVEDAATGIPRRGAARGAGREAVRAPRGVGRRVFRLVGTSRLVCWQLRVDLSEMLSVER